jgi:orotidine-5'-phosphate decarboxylase
MSVCIGYDKTVYPPSYIQYFTKVDYLKINPAFHDEAKINQVLEAASKKNIKVILDGKFGDIQNTQKEYVIKYRNFFGVTVNPFMGYDCIAPFKNNKLKCFVLLLTSNPSREDFEMMIYEKLRTKIVRWIKQGNEINLVIGATIDEDLFRETIEYFYYRLKFLPLILIPGIGKQGGDPKKIIKIVSGVVGEDKEQLKNLIFSNSSQIWHSDNPLAKIIKFGKQVRSEI